MATIPVISREYLHIPVSGAADTMPVEIAIVGRDAEPASGDWVAAEWDGDDAKVLIGPGGNIELEAGVYSAWVRVTSSPEIPVLKAGQVRIA